MDDQVFDRLTRVFGMTWSRRNALGITLGTVFAGLAGTGGIAEARNPCRGVVCDGGLVCRKGQCVCRHDADCRDGHCCDGVCCGRDPFTDEARTCCPNGTCSCGGPGLCCADCFLELQINEPVREFCCDASQDLDREVCPRQQDVCCEAGQCSSTTGTCLVQGPIGGSVRRP